MRDDPGVKNGCIVTELVMPTKAHMLGPVMFESLFPEKSDRSQVSDRILFGEIIHAKPSVVSTLSACWLHPEQGRYCRMKVQQG